MSGGDKMTLEQSVVAQVSNGATYAWVARNLGITEGKVREILIKNGKIR